MQNLGLNDGHLLPETSILNGSTQKPIPNTSSLSSQFIQNASMVKPGNCNLNSASPTPNLPIRKPASNTSNIASRYVQNRLMNKPASNNSAILHLATYASNSDNPVSRSGFGPQEVEHKLTPNNSTLDAMSMPKGWSNARPFLQSVCSCFDPQVYGLPPMKAILCDNMDTRYLLEASGSYYMYNEVSDTLWQIDRPTKLVNIVSALSDWKNITMTELELL